MRGKERHSERHYIGFRITPAYAGKSDVIASAFGTIQDHPRLCGEKLNGIITAIQQAGSPPPMRGKERVLVCMDMCLGITPAYAGKSTLLSLILSHH